jgi:hypothetical protein
MSEFDEQKAVIEWSELMYGRYPDLRMLYSTPNEGAGASRARAGKMKALGAKSGVPDLHLPVARGGWFGLYIEMKFGKNTRDDNQVWWHTMLHHRHHFVVTCWRAEDAIKVLTKYLSLPLTPFDGGIDVI